MITRTEPVKPDSIWYKETPGYLPPHPPCLEDGVLGVRVPEMLDIWMHVCDRDQGDLISKPQGSGICAKKLGCLEGEESCLWLGKSVVITAKSTAGQDFASERISPSSPLQVSPYTKSWLVIAAQRNEWAQKNVKRRECYNSSGKSCFFLFNFPIQLIFHCGLQEQPHPNAPIPRCRTGWSSEA